MNIEETIKLFGMANQLAESELDTIEERYAVTLGRKVSDSIAEEDEYYPQFQSVVRAEAATMSRHYELFYCLEKTVRELVRTKLEAERGATWWEECVPEPIRINVKANMQREIDSGITLRSKQEIDYTTFGELGDIVRKNWASFGGIFNSEKAFSRVMTNLNTLRGPIAHCCALPVDEVERLRLTVRDYFRLME